MTQGFTASNRLGQSVLHTRKFSQCARKSNTCITVKAIFLLLPLRFVINSAQIKAKQPKDLKNRLPNKSFASCFFCCKSKKRNEICNFLLAVVRKGFVRKSFSHKEANCFAPASSVVDEEREARRSVTQHNIVKEYHTHFAYQQIM